MSIKETGQGYKSADEGYVEVHEYERVKKLYNTEKRNHE